METTKTNTDLMDQNTLKNLLEVEAPSCVSIYIPAQSHNTAEPTEGPLRLKNQIASANEQLQARGMRAAEARRMLEPVNALLDDISFWQQQADGLAIFIAEDKIHTLRLPIEFREQAVVDIRFFIKPLLPLIRDNGRFYILSLELEGTELFECDRYSIREVDLGDVPTRLFDETKWKDYEQSDITHTGAAPKREFGRQERKMHGHGGSGEDSLHQQEILNFLKHLDSGLVKILGSEKPRMVFAGDEKVCGLYRKVSHYDPIAQDHVDGNRIRLGLEKMHQAAWNCVASHFENASREAEERYLHLQGTDDEHATDLLEKIVSASRTKRVDTLFVPVDHEAWGVFKPQMQAIERHQDWKPQSEDLLNMAAFYTLQNGGQVISYPTAGEVPGANETAAILRF